MDNYKNTSDNELLRLLQDSDHTAYNEIYHRYFHLIYTHAYKKLRDEDQAKDVVQEVFTNLWFKRALILPSSNLAGYLYMSVRNKVFDLFAHEQVKTKYVDSIRSYMSAADSLSTDHRVREKELSDYIKTQIHNLPPKMRKVFEMSRDEHLSYQEIAVKLEVTENNVSKQINNALRILRQKLGPLIFLGTWLYLFTN